MVVKKKEPNLRLLKPINANNNLPNRNHCFIGISGAGKTTALMKMSGVRPTSQVVIWDSQEEYNEFLGRKVRRYRTFSAFFRALYAARKSKQGFKIALTVDETRENFVKYCSIVKSMGDGFSKKLLFNICEESSNVTESAGKDSSDYGWLMRTGRKFGIITLSTGQASTEMPKTTYRNSAFKWFGKQDEANDFVRISAMTGIDKNIVAQMQNCDYIYKTPDGLKIGNLYAKQATIQPLLS